MRFPTKVALEVDGISQADSSPSSARGRDPDEWRLASADPRDSGTTKYRLHTIELYFWMQEDAKLILDIFKRLLDRHQLDLDEIDPEPEPEPELDHHDMVSPVVQNLENVAISDPAYHKAKTQQPTLGQPHPGQIPPPPPPPTLQAPPLAQQPAMASTGIANDQRAPAGASPPDHHYTPLAYNPAAPAAPEPIAHREDTPPPIDGSAGTGLSAALHDAPYVQQQQQQQQQYVVPPGPLPNPYGHYGSPPPQTFGPPTTSPPPPSFGPNAGASPISFGNQAATSPRTSIGTGLGHRPSNAASPDGSRHPSIAAQTYAPSSGDPNSHIFGQPPSVQTPGSQFYQSISQPHKPLQHVQPQYPDYLASGQAPQPAPPHGGFSNYQYGQPAQQQPLATAGNPYDVHRQFYRPTEAEHQTHHHSRPSKSSSSSQQKPGNVEKIEKGVGRFLKKIEKKMG